MSNQQMRNAKQGTEGKPALYFDCCSSFRVLGLGPWEKSLQMAR